jgi:hypothetical protein
MLLAHDLPAALNKLVLEDWDMLLHAKVYVRVELQQKLDDLVVNPSIC